MFTNFFLNFFWNVICFHDIFFSEYETRGHRGSISSSSKKQEEQQSWEWGQLPTSATPQHHSKESKNSELAGGNSKEHVIDKSANAPGGPGLISYLFGGQSSKKKVDDVPGMYLDDLEKADEEVNIVFFIFHGIFMFLLFLLKFLISRFFKIQISGPQDLLGEQPFQK